MPHDSPWLEHVRDPLVRLGGGRGGALSAPVHRGRRDDEPGARKARDGRSDEGRLLGRARADGDPTTQWEAGAQGAVFTVDLGFPRRFERIAARPGSARRDGPTDSWALTTSLDGVFPANAEAGGTCTPGVDCDVVHAHPLAKVARYVRVEVSANASPNATLAELSVYGRYDAVWLPDASSARLCNFSGATRTLALAIAR